MLSTAIIWGVIAKIANKMAVLSPLFNSLKLKEINFIKLNLNDIVRINGVAFLWCKIPLIKNLPLQKKRPYSVYLTIDQILKKGALFFNFCTKMHPSHVALPL